MTKVDGGPAFPLERNPRYNDGFPGMTLRQWYKGQALAGWAPRHFVPDTPRDIANACGKLADAVLAEDAAYEEAANE